MTTVARPSLFIVGHPKTGTTALHSFLDEHPSICMSRPKEPWHFCTDFHRESDRYHGRRMFFSNRSEEQYLRTFSHRQSETVVGEASSVYLRSRVSASEIVRFNPEARIVILLREPMAFLRALHKEFVRNAMEDEEDFETAISKDGDRRAGRHLPAGVPCPSWSLYYDWVDYARQIERFYEEFGKARVLVILSEDFRSDNPGVFKSIIGFLGVDEGFVPNFRRLNDRGAVTLTRLGKLLFNPRLRWISQRILPYRVYNIGIDAARRFGWRDTPEAPEIGAALAADLSDRFMPTVRETSRLLGVDLLSKWGGDQRRSTTEASSGSRS